MHLLSMLQRGLSKLPPTKIAANGLRALLGRAFPAQHARGRADPRTSLEYFRKSECRVLRSSLDVRQAADKSEYVVLKRAGVLVKRRPN